MKIIIDTKKDDLILAQDLLRQIILKQPAGFHPVETAPPPGDVEKESTVAEVEVEYEDEEYEFDIEPGRTRVERRYAFQRAYDHLKKQAGGRESRFWFKKEYGFEPTKVPDSRLVEITLQITERLNEIEATTVEPEPEPVQAEIEIEAEEEEEEEAISDEDLLLQDDEEERRFKKLFTDASRGPVNVVGSVLQLMDNFGVERIGQVQLEDREAFEDQVRKIFADNDYDPEGASDDHAA